MADGAESKRNNFQFTHLLIVEPAFEANTDDLNALSNSRTMVDTMLTLLLVVLGEKFSN